MSDLTDINDKAQKEIQRNFRWNFTVNALDGAAFWFGMSFFSSTIILPLFVSHFTSSPLAIGMIQFLGWAGVLLPPLFVANIIERAPRKKVFPVYYGFFGERLPVALLAPLTFFLAVRYPQWMLAVFFALYTWHNLGAGLLMVGWQDMIAKVIPVESRGRFFGITNFIGSGTGILGALGVPLLLERNTFPLGYVYTFAVAGGFILFSWFFMALTREPAVPSPKPPISQAQYLRSLPGILRQDGNFRSFLLAQIIFSLSGMANGFLVVYAVGHWSLPDAQASAYTVALQVGMTLANLGLGFLADRKGHKLNLEICYGLSALLLLLAVLAPSPAWFFLVFFLRGAVSAGTILSGVAITYEFTEPENRPTYLGLANTIPGVAMVLAPLLGGWLAGLADYRAMFSLALVFGLAGWALLRLGVREPRIASMS